MGDPTHAHLVLHANLRDVAWAKPQLQKASLLVSCDGAADILHDMGLQPHWVVGDLDSIRSDILASLQRTGTTIFERPDQNSTDFEKAIKVCLDAGISKVSVFGATGGRADFSFAHFLQIIPYVGRVRFEFELASWNIQLLLPGQHHIPTTKHQKLSLIPLEKVEALSIQGCQYNVKDKTWHLGHTGLSNRAIDGEVRISFQTGLMLLFMERNQAFQGQEVAS